MRDLSATLKTAQEAAVLEPKIKITFSLASETDIVIEEDRILHIPSGEESTDSQTAELVLDNAPNEAGVSFFTALNLQGWQAVIERGLVTASGDEYSAMAPMKVLSQYIPSAPGVLQCHLSLIGIPNRLSEDKASKDYFHHWSDTKTVKDMLTEIADGEPVATELTEKQEAYDPSVSYINLDANLHGAGQRISIPNRTVTKLSFRLKKFGSPSGNITFIIREVEAPQNILLTKVLANASTLTTDGVWYEVTFDAPATIDEEITYPAGEDTGGVWAYCEFVDGDASNYVMVSYSPNAVKPGEWIFRVETTGSPDDDWENKNEDCLYRYKYTGVGIDCWERGTGPETYCESYDVVYDDAGEGWFAASLLNTYMPKDAFKIYEGQNRLDKINQLLHYTNNEKIVKADGKLHVFVPVTSGATYDSEYSLASGHAFFSKAVRKSLVIPNRIVVKTLKTDETEYSGAATSGTSFALLPISDYRRTSLVNDAQGASIAAALISRLETAAQRGTASVPLNLGTEVFDYVKVTDSRASDSRTGNIGYTRWSYRPGTTFRMDFSFGTVPVKRVPGTKPSLLQEARVIPEPTRGETTLSWGMIKPSLDVIEQNFEYTWKSFDNILEIINRILSGLGWLEDQEPTDDQIDNALIPYYTKAQADALGYLRNLIEDTSPQLGGTLQLNNFAIRDIVNGIIISAGNEPINLTGGGTLYIFDGSLNMNTDKIINVGSPSANNDAANKEYVDNNVGISDIVEDTTPQLGGNLDTNAKQITGLTVLSAAAGQILLTFGTKTVVLNNSGNMDFQVDGKIIGLPAPTSDNDAARKKYVDDNAGISGTTWSDVTGSRAYGTEYENTSGSPLVIVVTGELAQDEAIAFEIGASTGSRTEVGRIENLNVLTQHLMGTIIVPVAYFYQVTKTGAPPLHDWHEYTLAS